MPRRHSIELLPDADLEQAVRRDWRALCEAGLPSMLDHTGESNTPHVTVVAVPELAESDEARAVDLLAPHLPASVRVGGLAVFGGERLTLARFVDVADALARAVLDLRAATAGHEHPGWLAHMTLARRVPRVDLQRAIDAIGPDVTGTLTGLRRWDPDTSTVRRLA